MTHGSRFRGDPSRTCPFGRMASAQFFSGPTPFCRKDTTKWINANLAYVVQSGKLKVLRRFYFPFSVCHLPLPATVWGQAMTNDKCDMGNGKWRTIAPG